MPSCPYWLLPTVHSSAVDENNCMFKTYRSVDDLQFRAVRAEQLQEGGLKACPSVLSIGEAESSCPMSFRPHTYRFPSSVMATT